MNAEKVREALALLKELQRIELIESATGKKIKLDEYLLADYECGGKKAAMAMQLKVTKRGLRKYEADNADALKKVQTAIYHEAIALAKSKNQ